MNNTRPLKRRDFIKSTALAALGVTMARRTAHGARTERPNIILAMADDQGWGQTGYYNHPFLKTPNLDAMAANGLRFDRFYAGGPVCSPTRASVLTGRSPVRTGVPSHGYPLCLQEKVLPQALQEAGYATGHFGKWHLNGLRGPGVPILAEDTHHPGRFGFDEWLSVTNFFDMDPIMGRKGKFEEFKGDSSEVIVAEALKFIEQKKTEGKPSFTVIWYGTPHSPWVASDADKKTFADLDEPARNHYGELVAMDRSIGTLRKGLRDLGIAENTLIWFNSDNGGLPNIPHTVGGLRGHKGSIWEGGLRVPGLIEWPAAIKPRITEYPAATMDIFPTLVDLLGLPGDSMLDVLDGISLAPLFKKEIGPREKPIPFQASGGTVLIDNNMKIIYSSKGKFQIYDLKQDPRETTNLIDERPEVAAPLKEQVVALADSIKASAQGADYPEGKITAFTPERMFWVESPAYEPHFEKFRGRPEYASQFKKLKTKNGGDAQKAANTGKKKAKKRERKKK